MSAPPLFPYSVLEDELDLTVDRVTGGGDRPPAIDSESGNVDLRSVSAWDRATLTLRVNVNVERLRDLMQGRESSVVGVGVCGPSNDMFSVPLASAVEGEWRGEMTIPRDRVFGKVVLHAELTTSVNGLEWSSPRVVGSSRQWTVYIDEMPPPPPGGSIPIEWVSFRNPVDHDLNFLTEMAPQPWYVRVTDQTAIVYLNSDFKDLHPFLASEDDQLSPAQRAVKLALAGQIAHAAWTAMFHAAASSVAEEGEDADSQGQVVLPEADWKRQVLEALLPRMYPEKADPAERLAEIIDGMRGDGDLNELESRLGIAVSDHIGLPSLVHRAFDPVATRSDEDAES